MKFSRSGDFEKVSRAFDLTGHSSGVYSFAFSADSGRMATVSKVGREGGSISGDTVTFHHPQDGHWKVFDTNIEYSRGQDAEVGDYN